VVVFKIDGTGQDIRLVKFRDFVIHQAVAFRPDDVGIEVLTSVTETNRQGDCVHTKFNYSAALEVHTNGLTLTAIVEIEIHLDETSATLLPVRKPAIPRVIDVEPEHFYSALAELGYDFSGRFRSLSGLQRKHYRATCLMKVPPIKESTDQFLIHPAELHAALQSVILAYSYPYDERLRNLHLPTSVQHIIINFISARWRRKKPGGFLSC
jgi:hypothetical protein